MSLGEKEVSLMGLRVRKRQLNCMEYSSFALSRAPKSRDENTLLYIKSDYISTLVLNQPPKPPPLSLLLYQQLFEPLSWKASRTHVSILLFFRPHELERCGPAVGGVII